MIKSKKNSSLLEVLLIFCVMLPGCSGPRDGAAQGQVQYGDSPNYYTSELETCRSIALKYHCTKLEFI